MKLEGEAVTFCPQTLGLEWGIPFERAGSHRCYMHFTADRSQYCENEQDYHQFDKHLAAERRPEDGDPPSLRLFNTQVAAGRSHLHRNEHQVSAASRMLHDQQERSNDGGHGGFYHHHKHHSHRSEDRDKHGDIEWERPTIAAPSCCMVYSSKCVNDGNSSVIEAAERPPFCEGHLDFPIAIMANPSRLVVGYALTAKKAESFLKPALVALARSKGIAFSAIHQDKPLLDQGPFDVILHKITGRIWHQQLKVYKESNPKVLILDPPEAIIKVYNRKSMLQDVAELKFQHTQGSVGVPKQLIVDDDSVSISEETARENLKFPLVAKPLWIDGTAKSHALSLAFNEFGLSSLTTPLVLQEFVNHGGVMFKVYVVGHLITVVHRPSLCDVCGDEAKEAGVVAFPRVSSAAALAAESDLDLDVVEYPPKEMLSALAKRLSSRLGLNLYNLDMIRENGKENQYYVIDINYFPGYGKVPDYEEVFTEFLSSIASEREPE